jgi:hypothetical protein
MGIATFPASSGGLTSVVKSVQRGSAGSSGNVTITAVDISKSMVNIFGTASSGTVAATGSLSAASGNASATNGSTGATNGAMTRAVNQTVSFSPFGGYPGTLGNIAMNGASVALNAQSISLNATNLSGGSTNLVAAVVQGFLANSTTLTVSGACRYEVVEFF